MSRAGKRALRVENDAYYTPDDVAEKCVAVLERAEGVVVEPSVGGGAFVRALRKLRQPPERIFGVDVDPAATGFTDCDGAVVGDWAAYSGSASWVIGNIPYSHAEAHCRHALKVAQVGVAFLLRLNFLEGQKRRAFWDLYPPRLVAVLSKRPSFTGGGTDATAYAFMIWKRHVTGAWAEPATSPRLTWI